MNRKIVSYRMEEMRWHFFAYNPVGAKILTAVDRLHDRLGVTVFALGLDRLVVLGVEGLHNGNHLFGGYLLLDPKLPQLLCHEFSSFHPAVRAAFFAAILASSHSAFPGTARNALKHSSVFAMNASRMWSGMAAVSMWMLSVSCPSSVAGGDVICCTVSMVITSCLLSLPITSYRDKIHGGRGWYNGLQN